MKKRSIALTGLGVCLLISSCTYDKDPFLDFKNEAKQKYIEYYEKNPGIEKAPLFYFDVSTLRSALVRNENEVSFLGQMKLVDFTFSESKNYFCDIGNLPISVEDGNNDGMPDRFKVGDFVSTDENGNTNFDVKTFVNNLPLVLHEVQADNTLKTYSMLSSDGTIRDSSNVKAYNPDFFYISDLKLNVQGLEGFADELLDFTGKDVCVLRKDLYQVLGELTATAIPPEIENFFSVPKLFNGLYRKAKGLKTNDEMPQTLTIQGSHYQNFKEESKREVVVGPFSLINELLNQVIETESTAETTPTSLIHEIPTIHIEEGVTTVSLFAFDGPKEENQPKSKIKDIYLPSTLQNVQFNAFSNLELNSLYINKTYSLNEEGIKEEKPFDFVDFGDVKITMGEGEDELELDVTGSFSHSKINKLYFEGYDNQNINRFPYSSTLNLTTTEDINKALNIYSRDNGVIDSEKTDNLNEAFRKYHTVNPFYQVVLTPNEDKKYVLSSGLKTLDAGQTLYLPSQTYSLSTNDSRGIYLGEVSREALPQEALLTLKLDQDLTIKKGGKLIVGSKIGSSKNVSGINAGEFSSLDLNGHKLVVEDGGTLIGDGFIFDSSKDKLGKIELKSGAKLTTNITINGYTNLNDAIRKIENGVAPFSDYSLNSLLVDTVIDKGATVIGNLDYIDTNFYNQNEITLISNSNQALFQLTSGKLVLNKSKISSFDDTTSVNINRIDLITIADNTSSEAHSESFGTDDFPFELGNKSFEVNIANVTNLTKLYADEDSKFSVKNLTLGNDSVLIGAKGNLLKISDSIIIKDDATKFTLSGEFSLNDKTYSSFKKIVQEKDGSLISKFSFVKSISNDSNEFNVTEYNLTGFVGQDINSFSRKILKNTSGYYYAYENSGVNGSLINSLGTTLATYDDSGTTWKVGSTDTKVNKNTLISSYGEIDKMFVLESVDNEVKWKEKKLNPLENGTYESEERTYIKALNSDELIEGSFLASTPIKNSIFESTLTGKKYVNAGNNIDGHLWLEVKGFDEYSTLQIVHKKAPSDLKYFALINGKYESGFDYNATQHIVSKASGVNKEAYVYTNEKVYKKFDFDKLNWENKQINDGENKLIYLTESSTWASVDELNDGLCKYLMPGGSFYYYFLIDGKWYQSVEGEMAKSYNELADMSFGVLKDKITYHGSKYKFVMKDGNDDNTPFKLFLPQEMIKVTKKDFPDLWPENTDTEHLYAYRHIVKDDGSKWMFFKDEATNKVTLKKFEFAPGFTPVQPDGNNTNVLTKFNFVIYKVIFEGEVTPRTLYVVTDSSDKNNAIYAGNTNVAEDGTLTDEYLAIAIFTTTNPINDLVNGNLPVAPIN